MAAIQRSKKPYSLQSASASEGAGHGYNLRQRPATEIGIVSDVDPAMVYRMLHQMERPGLVTSEWEDSADLGPAGRVPLGRLAPCRR